MKKLISILICIAVILTSVSQITPIVFAAGPATISCESKECGSGNTVTVDVFVSNNPGIMYLELTPTYSAELGTPTIKNGDLISDFAKGKNLVWIADNDVAEDGKLVSLTFNLSDTILPGDYSVGFILRGAYNYDEQYVAFTVAPGIITICGHESTHTVPAEKSTCQTHGHAEYTICDICGEILSGSAEELPLTDHDFVAKVTPTTCLDGGYTTYTCSICKASYIADITEPTGHTWGDWDIRITPTCTESGERYRICSTCNKEDTEVIPPNGHTAVVDAAVTPTCTESGLTVGMHCSVCNEVLTAQETVPALGHLPGDWTTIQKATTKAEGIEVILCSRCGEELQRRYIARIPKTPTLDVHVTAKELSAAEIAEAGIDVTAPENRVVKRFTIDLGYIVVDEGPSKIELVTNTTGRILDFGGTLIPYGGYTGTGWGCWYTNSSQTFSIQPLGISGDPEEPTYYFITLEGYGGFLKQIFSVNVLAVNTSGEYWYEDCNAEIMLPHGLSLVNLEGNQKVKAVNGNGQIAQGESGSATWYIKGDEAGIYDVEVKLSGKILPEPADEFDNLRYKTESPIQIDDASNLLEIELTKVPRVVHMYDEKTAEVTFKNVSKRTLNYVTCEITRGPQNTGNRLSVETLAPGESITLTTYLYFDFSPSNPEDIVYYLQHQTIVCDCEFSGYNIYLLPDEECTHSYGDWDITPATCTRAGERRRTCSICSGTESEEIPALGHDLIHHDAKAPTCTEIGWQEYDTCSRCNYTTYVELPALGHNLTHHNGKTPICTEIGWQGYDTCSRCDYTIYVEIPALGHSLQHHSARTPTCTEIGWEEYDTCSRCSYTTYVELPALGHSLQHHSAKAPTCIAIGWDEYDICLRCNYTTYVEFPALGHSLQHHSAKAPTCTEIGWEEYDTCSRCDYTTYVELAAFGHDLKHHNAKAPTCTAIGWDEYDTCSRCKYTTYVELAALGHDLIHHDAKAPTCTAAGFDKYDTCSRCDYNTFALIPPTGHNYVEKVTSPTCLKDGYTTHTCSVCDASYVSDITEALGHSWGEWQVIKDATKTEDGLERCYCENNHSHTMTREIPAYGYTPLSDFTYRLARGKVHITRYIGNDSEVIIPETYTINGKVRLVTVIEESAFEANDNITSVSLPATITSIEPYAFYDCTSLSDVVIWSKYAEIGEKAFGYYYISVKSDGKVDDFNLTAYEGSTAQAYMSENELSFIEQTKPLGLGDIDANGEYNSSDISTMCTYLMSSDLTEQEIEAADVNLDGTVSILDLIWLKKKLADL